MNKYEMYIRNNFARVNAPSMRVPCNNWLLATTKAENKTAMLLNYGIDTICFPNKKKQHRT